MAGTSEQSVLERGAPFDNMFGPVGEPARKGWWWWPLAVGGVVVFIVGVLVGRIIDGDGAPDGVAGTAVVAAGGPLGPIGGASTFSADRYPYAWPGQVLSAPDPTNGEAVAWQWELCAVPSAGDEMRCSPVSGATQRNWESPPTDGTQLVRVTVTVDLGGGVLIDALSPGVAAVPWPGNITPGDPPPTTAPPTTALPPETPFPVEAPPPIP